MKQGREEAARLGWWRNFRARCAGATERRLCAWGLTAAQRGLVWHYWVLFIEQVDAVIPISVMQASRWHDACI